MAGLPTRTLGRTGLQVTALGYGAMELRGAPRGREVSKEQAKSVLNAVLDSGINYIDESIDYGQSEALLGEVISERRSEYYLATKCGCLVGAEPTGRGLPHDYSRENIVAGVNQSLARMKTDYIDVMQFHGNPSKEVLEKEDAVQTVLDLQSEGKIRYIGMSATLPNLTDHIALGVFDVFQIPYSALEREHEAAMSQAAMAGAGIVVRGGVARGTPVRQGDAGPDAWQKANLDDLLNGMTRMEFMLRFTLSHPNLHTTIVGTINAEHLRDNLHALEHGPLPSSVYEEAKKRLA